MKAVWPVIVSNGVPLLQMRSVGSHSQSEREKEGNEERTEKERAYLLLSVGMTCCSWSHGLWPKKTFSLCAGATSSCQGSYPKATSPECRVSHVGRK